MRISYRCFRTWLCVIALCVVVSACTTTVVYDVSHEPIGAYPPSHPIDLKVSLVLTEELRRAKWEGSFRGDTYIIPVGEALPNNCEAVARAVFSSVSTERSPPRVDAVLTPKVVTIERTLPRTWWEDMLLTIVLEWKLSTPSGELVWIKTVSGVGKRPFGFGSAHKTNGPEQAGEALRNLFSNSYHAMISSPEMKTYSKGKAKPTQ